MNRQCGCELGDNCTKTTVCAVQCAVEDAVWEKDQEIEKLREALEPFAACDPTLLNPAVDPEQQWLWKPQGRKDTYGINIAHIIAAKEALK